MKRTVTGSREKLGGNFQESVFYKECKSIDEMRQAVDDAFDRGAELVTIHKPGRTERLR